MNESERIDKIFQNKILGDYKELTPEFAANLGRSLGSWLKKNATIAIARDFRNDNRMLKRAFTAGLMSSGISALDFHDVPTPLLQFYIRRFGADAGVMFTSSHYDQKKTGIRIFDEIGAELTTDMMNEIKQIYKDKNFRILPPSEMSGISDANGAVDVYVAAIQKIIDHDILSERNFKVVIDSSLGPVLKVMPDILTEMNFEVITINSYVSQKNDKNLPSVDSLLSLTKTVQANHADLGICFDVEGSRVLFCDEQGILRTSDEIASGIISHLIKKNSGTLIISESLTRNIENIIESSATEQRIVRIPNTPGNMSLNIRLNRGIFGASDDGSFWTPSFTVDSDGIFIALRVLEMIAENKLPLSVFLEQIPKYPSSTQRILLESISSEEILRLLLSEKNFNKKLEFKYALDTLIGVKLVFSKGWVHVYPNLNDRNAIHLECECQDVSYSNKFMDAVISKFKEYQKN